MTKHSQEPLSNLGIEFLAGLSAFFIPYGADQMGLAHSFWLGLGCWILGTAIAVLMFWIFPLWVNRLSTLEKGLIAFILLVVFGTIFYKPILTAYDRRNTPAEVTIVEQTQPVEKKFDQSSLETSAPAKTASAVDAPKIEPPKPRAQKRAEPSVSSASQSNSGGSNNFQTGNDAKSTVINAPGGIPIVGNRGTINSPTVNNFGPPPPTITFVREDAPPPDAPPPQDTTHPQACVLISTDRELDSPNFAVICDRACKGTWGKRINRSSGVSGGEEGGSIPNEPNVAAFRVNNSLPSSVKFRACFASADDKPVKALEVKMLTLLDGK